MCWLESLYVRFKYQFTLIFPTSNTWHQNLEFNNDSFIFDCPNIFTWTATSSEALSQRFNYPFQQNQLNKFINSNLLCWPVFSPQMVGTSEAAKFDPVTLKESTEQRPPARTVAPPGPVSVNVSKSNRRKQISKRY